MLILHMDFRLEVFNERQFDSCRHIILLISIEVKWFKTLKSSLSALERSFFGSGCGFRAAVVKGPWEPSGQSGRARQGPFLVIRWGNE